MAFVSDVFKPIQGIPQLIPAARAIRELHISPVAVGRLMRTYAGQLADMDGGDREFSYVTRKGKLLEQIEALALVSDETGDSSAILVWEAYRKFLVRHLRGPRCADT